jgi:ketosteroid isomerase-like protein
MRKCSTVSASMAVVLLHGAALAYAQSASSMEKDVLQAMEASDVASDKRDKAAMERLTADDYLWHASNGVPQNKAEAIADSMTGDTTWAKRTYGGLKVRVYGDLAVVTGTMTLAGTSSTYREGPRLVTRLFIRRDGRWQDLGGQGTLVPSK